MTLLPGPLVMGGVAAALGYLAARRSQKLSTVLCGIMLAAVLLKVAIGRIPAAEPRLFPWDWYAIVEPWWYVGPAMFLLGAGLHVARKSTWRRDLILVLCGVLLIRTGIVVMEGRTDHANLTGMINESGLCLQTSGYSFSAAAAAMFLHLHGVEATEREMAILCLTRPGLGGTTDSGIRRGLRQRLPDREIEVSAPRYEELREPAMVSILLNRWLAHSVVMLHVRPDHVVLLDPLVGKRTLTRDRFESIWQGTAITALENES